MEHPLTSLTLQRVPPRAENVSVQIRNTIGSPVAGENFFDRERERAHLWGRLETDNILLLAPRRVGKTSLLYKLEATAEQHGFRPVFVSVASHDDELAFLRALLDAAVGPDRLGGRVVARARKLVERIKSLAIKGASIELETREWQEIGADVLRTLSDHEQRSLVMIDELPIFVLNLLRLHGRERARLFLNWFRHVRQDRQAHLSVRWLMCGSIGLDTVTQRERLGDTIGDLAIVRLDEFSRDHAHTLLATLAKAYAIELREDVIVHMLDKIGWLIPYHLQLLFASVRDLEHRAPDIATVERAYAELLSNHHKGYFDTWYQRLRDELGPVDEAHALALLEVAALDPRGAPKSVIRELMRSRGVSPDLTRFLLAVLANDGYLVELDTRWSFRSPLLRDYWRAMVLT